MQSTLSIAAAAPGAIPPYDVASFEGVRPRLFGIARRVLGNPADADDVVQDAWMRWQGTDRSQVRDPAAFLTTMTARLAFTVGQSARVRREIATGPVLVDAVDLGADPSLDAERREALEQALRTLMEKLTPAERAAYLLREAFDYPHRSIAEALGLSETNARQIVTRARRHLTDERRRPADAGELQRLLDAFVAAAHTGDLATLEHVLLAEDELVAA